MTAQNSIRATWRKWNRPLLGFAIGLVLGPLITAAIGWQVSTDTLKQRVRDVVTREQAAMCEMLARQSPSYDPDMAVAERIELAERYAKFPWDATVGTEVVNRCSNDLAQEGTAGSDNEGPA